MAEISKMKPARAANASWTCPLLGRCTSSALARRDAVARTDTAYRRSVQAVAAVSRAA